MQHGKNNSNNNNNYNSNNNSNNTIATTVAIAIAITISIQYQQRCAINCRLPFSMKCRSTDRSPAHSVHQALAFGSLDATNLFTLVFCIYCIGLPFKWE